MSWLCWSYLRGTGGVPNLRPWDYLCWLCPNTPCPSDRGEKMQTALLVAHKLEYKFHHIIECHGLFMLWLKGQTSFNRVKHFHLFLNRDCVRQELSSMIISFLTVLRFQMFVKVFSVNFTWIEFACLITELHQMFLFLEMFPYLPCVCFDL